MQVLTCGAVVPVYSFFFYAFKVSRQCSWLAQYHAWYTHRVCTAMLLLRSPVFVDSNALCTYWYIVCIYLITVYPDLYTRVSRLYQMACVLTPESVWAALLLGWRVRLHPHHG